MSEQSPGEQSPGEQSPGPKERPGPIPGQGQAPMADSEVTQIHRVGPRDERVNYVGPPPDGFFGAGPPGAGGGKARRTQSRKVALAAVTVLAVALVAGGAWWALGGSGDPRETGSRTNPSASAQGPSGTKQEPPAVTRDEVVLVAFTFIDRVRKQDCAGAMALTGRASDWQNAAVTNITERYVCTRNVVLATKRGFGRDPVLRRLGDLWTFTWSPREVVTVELVNGEPRVTLFRADIGY